MEQVMTEVLRTLKPGGHVLVWAIPRTSHWTATAMENAGFEIRNVITHLFGSGSTGVAALEEEFSFFGIEKKPEYFQIAEKRMEIFCKED